MLESYSCQKQSCDESRKFWNMKKMKKYWLDFYTKNTKNTTDIASDTPRELIRGQPGQHENIKKVNKDIRNINRLQIYIPVTCHAGRG